jgi:hypothetical protein
MAYDQKVNQALLAILEMQKQQALVSGRLLGWGVAVADTLRKNPQFEAVLREHPYFDLGHQPTLRTIDEMIQNIDALIQQLKVEPPA